MSETTTREMLLPCPFCGAMPRFIEVRGLEPRYYGMCSIGCGACGPELYSRQQAIAAWNARASAPQPALDAGDQWRVEDRDSLGIDIIDARGQIVLRESFEGLPSTGAFREKHIARARAAAARIVSDHLAASSVPKLVEALKFVKQFFKNLENNGDESDPLTEYRRRYHAPVHAKIDEALAIANQTGGKHGPTN